MRFLRIVPAVWAMISCSLSSFTRKVALGSNSLTVPGNSSSSSFAIRPLDTRATRPKRHGLLAPTQGQPRQGSMIVQAHAAFIPRTSAPERRQRPEALADVGAERIAHLAVGVQHRLARAHHQ